MECFADPDNDMSSSISIFRDSVLDQDDSLHKLLPTEEEREVCERLLELSLSILFLEVDAAVVAVVILMSSLSLSIPFSEPLPLL